MSTEPGSPETVNTSPGITPRSLIAVITGMLLMGFHVQIVEVLLADGAAAAEQPLPFGAITVLLGFLLISGLVFAASKTRLLSRAEMLCVLFAMLIACPMMTQGMWHRFIGLISSPARTGSFSYLDAYNDKLWPHGPNLVDDAYAESQRDQLSFKGHTPVWEPREFRGGQQAEAPVLRNAAPDDVSSISVTIPVSDSNATGIMPGEPYLVSVLLKAEEMGPDSYYFVRIYEDDSATYNELAKGRADTQPTFLHQTGFERIGYYGAVFSPGTTTAGRVEVGLSGTGVLTMHDPKVFSVAALEGVYKGRKVIRRSDYEKLPPGLRGNLLVQPDNMWSLAGIGYLIAGYIPVRDWLQTAAAWSIPIFLLLMATLAVNVIMRRQWAEGERYPFPLVQIPRLLLGTEDEPETSALGRVWRNPFVWAGFAFAFAWGLLRVWNFYDPQVPVLNIKWPLAPNFSNPAWGQMWHITFFVSAFFLSICIFFELNVLGSMVLGFFLFRALFWIGEWTGLKVYSGYPFRYEQAIGAYIGYGLVVLFFTRTYLLRVCRSVIRFDRSAWQGEAMSYPAAMALIVLSFVGLSLWASWLGVPVHAIMLYFGFLLLVGFVATKFRTECGLPGGYFTPYNAMLFVALLGGMQFFGTDAMLFCLIASGFLTVSVFFFIPGAQLELLEFGRRYGVQRRHLLYTVVLGIVGGLFIGGWVFLSNAYAIGGQEIKYTWAFNQDWFFRSYQTELATATSEMAAGATQTGGWKPSTYAYLFGGGITVLLTLCRQLFAGFWFHPVGFVLGSAHMLEWSWGSALVAFVIRLIVLRLGGAATVREKLLPFFLGVFLGTVAVMTLSWIYGTYLYSIGVDRMFRELL